MKLRANDARLSPQAVRIPTINGTVYIDHHEKDCEVFATDINRAAVTRSLQQAIATLGTRARLVTPQPPSAPEDHALFYQLGTLADDPVPTLSITFPAARAGSMTARMASYRQITVSKDSAPGWSPSVDQSRQAIDSTRHFLSSLDEGRFTEAYAWMADVNKKDQSLAEFTRETARFNALSGPVKERRILLVTWTKDPPVAPYPGIYAAVDLASRFANVDRHCGYIVLYQPPTGGSFVVMRRENTYLDNATAQKMEKERSRAEVESAWAQASRHCPNYPR